MLEAEHIAVLAKLSKEDREKYAQDLMVFGNACVRAHEDGSVTYVPIKDVRLDPHSQHWNPAQK